MATKNPSFTGRLNRAIADTGLKNPAFAEKAKMGYSTLMNYLKPGNIGHVPEWDQLVKISDACKRSVDWLLTGKEDVNVAEDRPTYTTGGKKCPVDCDDDFIDLCRKVKEVIDSPYSYSESLKANIHSFHEAVEEKRGKEAKSAAGTPGGTQKSPAERTAKVRKAG